MKSLANFYCSVVLTMFCRILASLLLATGVETEVEGQHPNRQPASTPNPAMLPRRPNRP